MRYPLGLLLNFPPGNSDEKIKFYAIKFRKYPICILNTTAAFTDIFLYNFKWEYSHSVILCPQNYTCPPTPRGDGTPLYKTYRNMPPNCADPNGRVFCRLSTSPLRERQRRAGTLAPETGNGLWKSLGFCGVLVWKRVWTAYFGLESGMVYKGTTVVYGRFYHFSSKWLRKKEKMQMQNGF